MRAEISALESKIVSLSQLKDSGFATARSWSNLKKAKQKLQYLISDAGKQKKRRKEKRTLTQVASENSYVAKLLVTAGDGADATSF